MSPTPTYATPTRSLRIRDNTSTWTSTSSPPPGHKPTTPLVSGTVCGGLVAIAWLFTLVWYLYRRRNRVRKDRLVEAGVEEPPPRRQDDKYIIPPDPAILEGQKQPGAHVTEDDLAAGNSKQAEAGPSSAAEPTPNINETVSDLSACGNVTKRDYAPSRKAMAAHTNDPPAGPSEA